MDKQNQKEQQTRLNEDLIAVFNYLIGKYSKDRVLRGTQWWDMSQRVQSLGDNITIRHWEKKKNKKTKDNLLL